MESKMLIVYFSTHYIIDQTSSACWHWREFVSELFHAISNCRYIYIESWIIVQVGGNPSASILYNWFVTCTSTHRSYTIANQMTSLFYVLNFNRGGAAEGQCSLLRNDLTDILGMQKVRLTVGAGFWLVNSVNMMMPAENMSIFSSYCVSALRVSGAIYIGVPGHRDIISNTSPWNVRARPTSAIFAAPAVIRIFAGFRSRWISLSQWRYRRPADMSIRYDRVWRKLSGGVALILDARLSSISSINRHGHLFGACPTPIKETTEGWLSWRRRRHSSPNRSINSCRPGFPGEINIGWSTFAATFCPSYKVR